MMEKVPQLTEDQKLIVEALKARQEKVRISKRLISMKTPVLHSRICNLGFTSHFNPSFVGIKD